MHEFTWLSNSNHSGIWTTLRKICERIYCKMKESERFFNSFVFLSSTILAVYLDFHFDLWFRFPGSLFSNRGKAFSFVWFSFSYRKGYLSYYFHRKKHNFLGEIQNPYKECSLEFARFENWKVFVNIAWFLFHDFFYGIFTNSFIFPSFQGSFEMIVKCDIF